MVVRKIAASAYTLQLLILDVGQSTRAPMMQVLCFALLFTALVCAEQESNDDKEATNAIPRDFSGLQDLVNQYANEYYSNGRNGDNNKHAGKLFLRQPRHGFFATRRTSSLIPTNFMLY
ncbi:hypothetical protein M514_03879 [Trichuris suis]|uniref:Neuropeptide F n=1 Tax=Trichuris suis TaxID=68888 RepID=A0A085N915_9BILA|nr:hypothetical protein M513_03879 [Trichuris suis]KFD65961.1 hypothetical protein M514_03879 [Trichuris suis]KHJ45204.1 hypothetical protein D918_04508 [Trichuris suis]